MKKTALLAALAAAFTPPARALHYGDNGLGAVLQRAVQIERLEEREKSLEAAVEKARAVPAEVQGVLVVACLEEAPPSAAPDNVLRAVRYEQSKDEAKLAEVAEEMEKVRSRLSVAPDPASKKHWQDALYLGKLEARFYKAKIADLEQDADYLSKVQPGDPAGLAAGIAERKIKIMQKEIDLRKREKLYLEFKSPR